MYLQECIPLKIIYSKSAVKTINKLESTTKKKLKNAINGLTKQPPTGDIKMLKGTNPSEYRLRIGKYRIIYEYKSNNEEQVLAIKDIGSRGDIYK